MDCTTKQRSRQREKILLLSHPDGTLEIFTENADVHLVRVPAAFSRESELQAEAIAEALIPYRFKDLWRADKLKKIASTRPLLPSTIMASREAAHAIKSLNRIAEAFTPSKQKGVVVWSL